MANLSDRLRKLRQEKKLTQEQLGKILGIGKSTISMYENNNSTPDDELKKKITEFFNVSLDYLMGKSDIRNPYTETLKTIDEKYPPVSDVEEAMKIIMTQPGLMLKGELLTDEDKIILANSIQNGLKLAEELRKKRREKMEGK